MIGPNIIEVDAISSENGGGPNETIGHKTGGHDEDVEFA